MDKTKLTKKLEGLPVLDILQSLADTYTSQTIFTTSFGIEDQVITDMIFKNNLNIKVVTLDTGRLFEQTYKVFHLTREKYKKNIEVFYPNTESVQNLLSSKGPLSFYESVENRKECCNIRKVEPLGRALNGMQCWITGIRAEQSFNRTAMEMLEHDTTYNILKVHPLFDWTLEQVMNYLRENNVPYNSLHHDGFVSIGCTPCTRAIEHGEDFRAGRWWWENSNRKECGLHSKK